MFSKNKQLMSGGAEMTESFIHGDLQWKCQAVSWWSWVCRLSRGILGVWTWKQLVSSGNPLGWWWRRGAGDRLAPQLVKALTRVSAVPPESKLCLWCPEGKRLTPLFPSPWRTSPPFLGFSLRVADSPHLHPQTNALIPFLKPNMKTF